MGQFDSGTPGRELSRSGEGPDADQAGREEDNPLNGQPQTVSSRYLCAFAPVAAGFCTGGGFVEPTLRELWKAIDAGDRAAQERLAQRFTAGIAVEHVFRATALALMVVPF